MSLPEQLINDSLPEQLKCLDCNHGVPVASLNLPEQLIKTLSFVTIYKLMGVVWWLGFFFVCVCAFVFGFLFIY